MKRAVITLPRDENAARVITGALHPETHRGIPRTSVNVRENEGCISLEILAEDTNALRAASAWLSGVTIQSVSGSPAI